MGLREHLDHNAGSSMRPALKQGMITETSAESFLSGPDGESRPLEHFPPCRDREKMP